MKKQTVVMLWASIILLIIVGCIGIYLADVLGNSKNKNGIEIINCAATDIEEYEVLNKGIGYTIYNDGGVWKLKNNDVAVLDEKKITDLINAASRITATGIISDKEFKQYTHKEELEICVSTVGKEQTRIIFIGENAELCAFRVEGDEKIYTMYCSTRNILTPDLNSLRKFELFENIAEGEENPDYYEYIDYSGSRMVVRTKTNYEISKSDANRYLMTEPYESSVDDEKFEQQILVKAQTMTIDGVITDAPEAIEPYGLNKNERAEITLGYKDRKETLYLGRHEGNMVYAQKKGTESVVVIDSSKLEFLHVEPFYILEGGILKSEFDKIKRISIVSENGSYELTKQKTGDTYNYFLNGKAMSEGLFTEIAEALGNISVLNEVGEVPANKGEIVINVSYYSNQSPQTIALTTINDKKYAAFVNGKAEFAIDKKATDEVIKRIIEATANPIG